MNFQRAVKKRANGYCEACGIWAKDGGQAHHIVFKGMGGSKLLDDPINGIWLCLKCHSKAHNKREFDLRLKRDLQEKYFSMGLSEDEVRKKMGGRLYE